MEHKKKSAVNDQTKKVDKKNRKNPDEISLKIVSTFSDKKLLPLFSKSNWDELNRKFSFACMFRPKRCATSFSSVGNEFKAQRQMVAHIKAHLSEDQSNGIQLVKLRDSPSTLNSNRKKAKIKALHGRHKSKNSQEEESESELSTCESPVTLKPTDNSCNEILRTQKYMHQENGETNKYYSVDELKKLSDENLLELFSCMNSNELLRKFSYTCRFEPGKCETSFKSFGNHIKARQYVVNHLRTHVKNLKVETESDEDFEVILTSGLTVMSEHSYVLLDEQSSSKKNDKNTASNISINCVFPSKNNVDLNEKIPLSIAYLPFPNIYDPNFPNISQIEVYPNDNSVKLRSSEIPIIADLRDVTKQSAEKSNTSKDVDKTWEKKFAMMNIRQLTQSAELRHASELKCEICQKPFRASSSLIVHYRSHAGIKPFSCTLCNSSFTRKNTLKYHMLIHSNSSRFTCQDCGKKFRHSDHYKEHIRNHSGEAPYECSECPNIRYKSRNAYKRHLKICHGKLLTANGIIIMRYEDFKDIKDNSISNNDIIQQAQSLGVI